MLAHRVEVACQSHLNLHDSESHCELLLQENVKSQVFASSSPESVSLLMKTENTGHCPGLISLSVLCCSWSPWPDGYEWKITRGLETMLSWDYWEGLPFISSCKYSWHCHIQAVWPWASQSTSLNINKDNHITSFAGLPLRKVHSHGPKETI